MMRLFRQVLAVMISLVFISLASGVGLPSVSATSSDPCQPTSGGNNPVLDSSSLNVPKVGCSDTGNTWLKTLLSLVFGVMSMLSLLFVAIGAFKYTTSGGSSDAIASAKKTIIYALLGLLLGVSAFTITNVVLRAVS